MTLFFRPLPAVPFWFSPTAVPKWAWPLAVQLLVQVQNQEEQCVERAELPSPMDFRPLPLQERRALRVRPPPTCYLQSSMAHESPGRKPRW